MTIIIVQSDFCFSYKVLKFSILKSLLRQLLAYKSGFLRFFSLFLFHVIANIVFHRI